MRLIAFFTLTVSCWSMPADACSPGEGQYESCAAAACPEDCVDVVTPNTCSSFGVPPPACKTCASAKTTTALIIFGDSISDTGNALAASQCTFPPSPPYTGGGFSNGRLWPAFISEKRAFSIYNEAYGGSKAMAGDPFSFGPFTVPDLEMQVDAYLARSTHTTDWSSSIAIFQIGANDYILPASKPRPPVGAVVSAISASVRRFLSARPAVEQVLLVSVAGPTLAPWAAAHLAALRALRSELAVEHPTVKVEIFDPNDVFVADLTSELGVVAPPDSCTLFDNFVLTPICDDPDEYFLYDRIHPSEKGHSYLADMVEAFLLAEGYQLPPALDATVQGDPHFVGFDGRAFDYYGVPGSSFTVLSTRHTLINALLGPELQHGLTYMAAVGVSTPASGCRVGVVNGRLIVHLNDVELERAAAELPGGGTVVQSATLEEVTITTHEVVLTLGLHKRDFLDITAVRLVGSPDVIHGVLGQTAAAGDRAELHGFEGREEEYIASSLWADDSAYGGVFQRRADAPFLVAPRKLE